MQLFEYSECRLCARSCGVDRNAGKLGVCRVGADPVVARAALHAWEEPPISGTHGSGTVFFAGCSLGCIYCQNSTISRAAYGKTVTIDRLCEIMLELEGQGAHNINFVTPTHYAPSIIAATRAARVKGLSVPIVYNTSSYDTPETIRSLDGVVDIYLADYKYTLPRTAAAYSHAVDYPDVARAAIAEMVKQKGGAVIRDGIMQSGVIVRVLLLPGHVAEAKLCVKYLYETYGDSIYISLMSQYTPMPGMPSPLDRPVTSAEYDELVDYAVKKGLTNAFIQDGTSAKESFIPPFDNTGV